MAIDFPVWISALAASIGLIFTGLQIRTYAKTNQLQLTEHIFENLMQLSEEYNRNKHKEVIPDDENLDNQQFSTRHGLNEILLDHLEWLSMLVNKKRIKDKTLIYFFEKAIIIWYEDIYINQLGEPKDKYFELQHLYSRIKKKKG